MIDVEHLTFEYSGKRILHDMSFQTRTGDITALVGPNGAGKTTLLRCLAGLEQPLTGKVSINGIDVHEKPREAHRIMGYLSDFFGLYNDLTVRQCLTYMAWCHKVPADAVLDRIEDVARQTDIEKYLGSKAGTLSRGYRQRLGIGLALVHRPKILLLDEPASGMDPEARIGLSRLMLDLKAAGVTIMVSSHILAELEDYCTDMLVIRDGRIAEHVKLQDHKDAALNVLHIGILRLSDFHSDLLRKNGAIKAVQTEGETAICTMVGDKKEIAGLLDSLVKAGVPVYSFTVEKRSLQSAYMDLAKGVGVNKA